LVQLTKTLDKIEAKGAKIWAISPQTVELNLALQERRDVGFPILADPDQATIRAWGVFDALDPKERAIPYPATYIVGEEGRVVWAHVGASTRDRPTVGEIIANIPNRL
jgi:peroxiredoxin